MKMKDSVFYQQFHPVLWMLVGAGCVSIGIIIYNDTSNYNLETLYLDITGQSSSYKTGDGKFACWFIDEVMKTSDYEELGDFEKEIFQVTKKYCVEIPRP